MLNLLVIEDEESDYHFIEMALKECRFATRVRWVIDGHLGTRYLAGEGEFADRGKHPFPDVVLVDLKMPGMDGFELLQWIRTHPVHHGMPVLVMSSSALPADIEKAYANGASSYFVKPSNFEDFVDLFQHIAAYWSYACSAGQVHAAAV